MKVQKKRIPLRVKEGRPGGGVFKIVCLHPDSPTTALYGTFDTRRNRVPDGVNTTTNGSTAQQIIARLIEIGDAILVDCKNAIDALTSLRTDTETDHAGHVWLMYERTDATRAAALR